MKIHASCKYRDWLSDADDSVYVKNYRCGFVLNDMFHYFLFLLYLTNQMKRLTTTTGSNDLSVYPCDLGSCG